MRFDERLLFCTCRTCASIFDSTTENVLSRVEYLHDDGTVQTFERVEDICMHKDDDEAREFVAVLGHDELGHALEKGYTVKKLYHGLVWP